MSIPTATASVKNPLGTEPTPAAERDLRFLPDGYHVHPPPRPPIVITAHARARSQQRGITNQAIGLIMRYGDEKPIRHGAYAFYMTSRARQRVLKSADRDQYIRLSDRLDAYVVVDAAGTVVTVARPEQNGFRRRDGKKDCRQRRIVTHRYDDC